jgi:hypothetical protein
MDPVVVVELGGNGQRDDDRGAAALMGREPPAYPGQTPGLDWGGVSKTTWTPPSLKFCAFESAAAVAGSTVSLPDASTPTLGTEAPGVVEKVWGSC